jgi:hypothetical protein
MIAVTVAVLVLTALVGLLEIQRHDSSPDVTSAESGSDTGWFLPPDGWSVVSIVTDQLFVGEGGACPCTSWVAARPGDGGVSIELQESADAGGTTWVQGDPIDVGGRPGKITSLDAGSSMLGVASGGRQVVLRAHGVEDRDLVALADAALDQRDAGDELAVDALPLPAGFVGTRPVAKPDSPSEHLVLITVEELASGRELTYQVVPAGYLRQLVVQAQALEVGDGVISATGTDETGGGAPLLLVLGGPEDLMVGGAPLGGPVDTFTADELRSFAAGLHEVTTADWRRALADAAANGQVETKVLEADTLTSGPLIGPMGS